MKAKCRRHGTKGRINGDSSRVNALKEGAHAADAISTRAYIKRLTTAIDAMPLVDNQHEIPQTENHRKIDSISCSIPPVAAHSENFPPMLGNAAMPPVLNEAVSVVLCDKLVAADCTVCFRVTI